MPGSFKASSPDRNPSDFYQTPPSITRQLLAVESFPGPILEPARGHGAIVRVLEDEGYEVVAKDWDDGEGQDFLTETERCPSIVTNPPFCLALKFVEKIQELQPQKAALFLPLDYLHGIKRFKAVYQASVPLPLARVYVLVRRPMLSDADPGEFCYATGSVTFAWFVFEPTDQEPVIRWIDNSAYCSSGQKREEMASQLELL